ncbi:hypothetical protein [Millionella massiliensis]|uniref:hypothetical protein n=1 Tax=Millionella massiliensis TaxID=1871023 RepID=UPI0008DA3AF5|nr:hypothetical protein [Millionella massiliensis]
MIPLRQFVTVSIDQISEYEPVFIAGVAVPPLKRQIGIGLKAERPGNTIDGVPGRSFQAKSCDY